MSPPEFGEIMSKPRVGVVGAGAFGQNHCRVVHESERAELAAIVDSDSGRASEAAARCNTIALTDARELIGKVDAAVIAAPTSVHAEIGCLLLEAGIDVLVEKPIAIDLAAADRLIDAAERNGRILQVGHLERFNPAVIALEQRATLPLFFEIHRMNLFSPRSLDVDVVLDLMIHDIDVVLSLVKSPLKELRAVGLPVVTEKVDIANVRMEFESGCVANLTASRISTERVRKLRFFQPKEYISIDYGRQDVFQIRVTQEEKFSLHNLMAFAETPSALPIPGVTLNKPKVEAEEPLRAELKSFLQAVRHRSEPVVSLKDGRRALAAALSILSAIEEHTRRAQLHSL